MDRKKQIEEAIKKAYRIGDPFNPVGIFKDGFRRGADWADLNPLPPGRPLKNGGGIISNPPTSGVMKVFQEQHGTKKFMRVTAWVCPKCENEQEVSNCIVEGMVPAANPPTSGEDKRDSAHKAGLDHPCTPKDDMPFSPSPSA